MFYGLYAPQYRGQESAGMAAADGRGMLVYPEMGLVRQLSDEATLASLQGHLAIGHTHHSSTGGLRWENAQPAYKTNAPRGRIAVAHNDNLTTTTTTTALAGHLIPQESAPGWPVRPGATSDTDVIAELLAGEADLSLEEAIVRTMSRLEALTETAAPAGADPAPGRYAARFTGSCPILIPDAAGPDLTASAATQPSTLPLPNPEPEVAR